MAFAAVHVSVSFISCIAVWHSYSSYILRNVSIQSHAGENVFYFHLHLKDHLTIATKNIGERWPFRNFTLKINQNHIPFWLFRIWGFMNPCAKIRRNLSWPIYYIKYWILLFDFSCLSTFLLIISGNYKSYGIFNTFSSGKGGRGYGYINRRYESRSSEKESFLTCLRSQRWKPIPLQPFTHKNSKYQNKTSWLKCQVFFLFMQNLQDTFKYPRDET